MSVETINPSALREPVGYSHVVVASGTKRVYVAGQTGAGPDGVVVGPDLASQTAQSHRNVCTALEAGGATWDDVAKMTIPVVGYEPSMAEALFGGVGDVFGDAMPSAATTLRGVQSLFEPECLVEIEAIAELRLGSRRPGLGEPSVVSRRSCGSCSRGSGRSCTRGR